MTTATVTVTDPVIDETLSVTSEIVAMRAVNETVRECIDSGKPCIKNDLLGYRVLHTQERGKVLETPAVVGFFPSIFNTEDVLRQYRKGGSFAIMSPLYGCGHDHNQWDEYWR